MYTHWVVRCATDGDCSGFSDCCSRVLQWGEVSWPSFKRPTMLEDRRWPILLFGRVISYYLKAWAERLRPRIPVPQKSYFFWNICWIELVYPMANNSVSIENLFHARDAMFSGQMFWIVVLHLLTKMSGLILFPKINDVYLKISFQDKS